ncbi:ABA4-like family protein [Synechococcus elongatus IITB7]|uniref:ABA4-like family protein n=1 Tax=Synechococcus elongatus TaxID=32046 RepID=UPI0030D523B1
MLAELFFNGANLAVLPFWLLLIGRPRWTWTQRIVGSPYPFAVLAIAYLFLLVTAVSPESAAALASPKLADIAQAFADPGVTAAGWIHFVVLDLFVGRWVAQTSVEKPGLPVRHSLVLCLFAGPLGLLSHLITQAIWQWWQQRQATSTTTA